MAGPYAIGVLALQGDFAEHASMLRSAASTLGLELLLREVRLPRDLEGLDGLIVPGGESTTIGKLLVTYGLELPIRELAQQGIPVWGTCAGMILLANQVEGGAPDGSIGLMDMTVQRNAFGRQRESFEIDLPFEGVDHPIRAVFIRAPIVEALGPRAHSLAALKNGAVVAVRQGNLLATAFHPELTNDDSVHAWFLREMVAADSTESQIAV